MIGNLKKTGFQNMNEIPPDVFLEFKVPIILADYWIILGEQVHDIIGNDFGFIRHSALPSTQKVVAILSDLRKSNHPVSVTQFIQILEKIIPLIQHSGFFSLIGKLIISANTCTSIGR